MNECNNSKIQELYDELINISLKLKSLSDRSLSYTIGKIADDVKTIDETICLKYNNVLDEAYEMADNLNEIDDELVQAAQHTGKYNGEYSADFLLGNLCKIMYKSLGYHKQDKYNTL